MRLIKRGTNVGTKIKKGKMHSTENDDLENTGTITANESVNHNIIS